MRLLIATSVLCLSVLAGDCQAIIQFDQNVTPDVIFGSGNDNGSFTTDRVGSVELGLRGKLRFDAANQPQNIFNSNGDGTYSFDAGNPPSGFGFDSGSPTTPVWNFEWSVNSNRDGSGGALDTLTYTLGIDGNPTTGTTFATFDMINVPAADHALGTNGTGNGGGVSNALTYASNISSLNVAQNSWNYEFFNESTDGLFLPELADFNPNAHATYTIFLSASDATGEIARTTIDIIVGEGGKITPEPVSFVVWAFLAGCGALPRRRRTQSC